MKNYKEIKNHIHNDLKITKDDIQKIIEKSVQVEIRNLFNQPEFKQEIIQNYILWIIKNNLEKTFNSTTWNVFSLNQEIYNKICDTVFNEVRKAVKISLSDEYLNNAAK